MPSVLVGKRFFFDNLPKEGYDGAMKSIDQKRILSLPYPLTLRVAEVTASTNDDLKAEARAGAKDYT